MQMTPVLLPAFEFDVLLVSVESEDARMRRSLLVAEEVRREGGEGRGENDEVEGGQGGASASGVGGDNDSATAAGETSQPQQQSPPTESEYCRNLAELFALSPFHMPQDYERRAAMKAERARTLQQAMATDLTEPQRLNLEGELNRGFRDWLVTSGNLRQVLDLVNFERRVAGA